jgi:hypothetical protein
MQYRIPSFAIPRRVCCLCSKTCRPLSKGFWSDLHHTCCHIQKHGACRFLHPTKGDAKNFHAWNYRFWLVARMHRSDEDELTYCQHLIEADRSNFSAWHYRSVLLPRVHNARGHLSLDALQLVDKPFVNTGCQDQATRAMSHASDVTARGGKAILAVGASGSESLQKNRVPGEGANDCVVGASGPAAPDKAHRGYAEAKDAVGLNSERQQTHGIAIKAHSSGAVGVRIPDVPLYELQSELNFLFEVRMISIQNHWKCVIGNGEFLFGAPQHLPF